MKKYFLSLVAMLIATVSFAQGSLLATLNHEGTVSTFYGASAWKNAHNAATHGDVITLSSGTFVATDITKAVTVRGAGMGIDTTSVAEPTVITGDFAINIPDSVTKRLTLEGIYSNHEIRYKKVKNPLFLKCRMKKVWDFDTSSVMKDASFIHCRIATWLYLGTNCSASCVNSVIQEPHSYNDKNSNFEFVNCCLIGYMGSVRSSSFKNCIIRGNGSNDYINSSCTAYNCIGLGNTSMFKYITNSTNKIVSDYASLFKTYTGAALDKLDSENFQLTDAAKTQYLGTDGTEIGIYGGSLPFDPTTSNPQITKCNVASKSTADGKLSVDIEVNAAE